jgi:hypothetical protein
VKTLLDEYLQYVTAKVQYNPVENWLVFDHTVFMRQVQGPTLSLFLGGQYKENGCHGGHVCPSVCDLVLGPKPLDRFS